MFLFTANDHNTVKQFAHCELWDFAEEKGFYAMHQTFLCRNAVYLFVADLFKEFTSKIYNDMMDKELDSIGGLKNKISQAYDINT